MFMNGEEFRQAEKTGGNPNEEEQDFSWLNFEDVDQLPDVEPEVIIKGLLRIGEKLGITSGSKNFKTWVLLYLGFCIANGLDFLGFKTKQSKVIVFDLELSRWALKRRLQRIQKELGTGDFKNVKVCGLRGKARLFCKNLNRVKDRIVAGEFKVVIIDPAYKFLLGKDERDNGMVAGILEDLTVFCMEAQVAMIYVHHHSKGNQAEKNSLDRSSGAGAWSRDPDAVLDLAEHKDSTKEEKIYTAEITVREFPPIENFVVRWKFPLLVRDHEGLDPAELKQPSKGGRPQGDAEEKIIIALRTAECVAGLPGLTVTEIQRVADLPRRTVYDRIKRMPEKVVKCVTAKGFQLSVGEREKVSGDNNDEADEGS